MSEDNKTAEEVFRNEIQDELSGYGVPEHRMQSLAKRLAGRASQQTQGDAVTDRIPTKEEANSEGMVWVWCVEEDECSCWILYSINSPWSACFNWRPYSAIPDPESAPQPANHHIISTELADAPDDERDIENDK